MGEKPSGRDAQVFTCPGCAGPLRVLVDGRVECKVGHRYEVADAVRIDTEKMTCALLRAVDSLRNRAAMSRWAARNPHLYPQANHDAQRTSATVDDEMADVLLRHLRVLDPSAHER